MQTFNGKDIPKLKLNEFLVFQAEVWTGIILDLQGKRRNSNEEKDWILIFESLEQAETFANNRVAELPDVECWVQNYNGEYKKRIFNEGDKQNTRTEHFDKRAMWKFW